MGEDKRGYKGHETRIHAGLVGLIARDALITPYGRRVEAKDLNTQPVFIFVYSCCVSWESFAAVPMIRSCFSVPNFWVDV